MTDYILTTSSGAILSFEKSLTKLLISIYNGEIDEVSQVSSTNNDLAFHMENTNNNQWTIRNNETGDEYYIKQR